VYGDSSSATATDEDASATAGVLAMVLPLLLVPRHPA
jgi:hypothetical protein